MRSFFVLLKPYTRRMSIALGAILLGNGLGLLFPWGLKTIIDEVAIAKRTALLLPVTTSLCAAAAGKFYFSYLREYLLVQVGEECIGGIRGNLYAHLKKLSVAYLDRTPHGEVISRIIGDVDRIRDFLFGGTVDFLYSFLNVFFILIILFVLDWPLAVISVAFIPPLAVLFLKLTPRLRKEHDRLRLQYASLTRQLYESCQGMRIISGFGREPYEIDHFRKKQSGIVAASCRAQKLGILLWLSAELLGSLGLVILVFAGTKAILAGRISVGTLLAFYSYVGMLFYPLIKLVLINTDYQEAAASLRRITELSETEPVIKPAPSGLALGEIRGEIEFSEVTFGYRAETPVITSFDLTISAGEIVALIGPSGSGKTTLVNLLLRFYDPDSGSIRVDGHDIKTLNVSAYRSHIAIVLQDDYLFNTSVTENIRYGNLNASQEDIRAAARQANADEFVNKLKNGYNTVIGEKGITLSYGQRQRIAIARAIVRNPRILILDEATSNVDSESERKILAQAYRNLMRGRTTLIIAHRLSTIQTAHRIIVLGEGRIEEAGTHSQLLAHRGRYHTMWRSQHPDNEYVTAQPERNIPR